MSIVGRFLVAAVVAALAWLTWGWYESRQSLPAAAGMSDPAIEFHARDHGRDYGGIDRWAHAGMDVSSLRSRLLQAGYRCELAGDLQLEGAPLSGRYPLECRQDVQGWLARQRLIKAMIDYDHGGRLLSAEARSDLPGSAGTLQKAVLGLLRTLGRAEPESLKITGLPVDSSELLARLAADAINPDGWTVSCIAGENPGCPALLEARRNEGLPPLPQQPLPVRDLDMIGGALGGIGLVPPGAARADIVPVRLAGDGLWTEYRGSSLSGQAMKLSLRVNWEDGSSDRLRAQLEQVPAVDVPLKGQPRLSSGQSMVLVPLRPDDAAGPAMAKWLVVPGPAHDGQEWEWAGRDLQRAHADYAPRLLRFLLARMLSNRTPDEALDLYPPLALVEALAQDMRKAQLNTYLPIADAVALMKGYGEQTTLRAAWALATCQPDQYVPKIDDTCWQQLVVADPGVSRLFVDELQRIKPIYAPLPLEHPLRLRLWHLEQALRKGGVLH
ncbi:hypothetical protein D0B54_11940 [Solimonas sp. K1W22B-7]|uniref:hypothetical protein n=1 Tax=Solimonas sp. K1W22B-7 TaxID=2303331 RepID=UPI000E33544D|nr:hypothetical protein [Solimonas sp. K1W22B-7]AXQ29360.1 hypothetical protein D0B54_11940 [Solimonas sp. K1W22B-7]